MRGRAEGAYGASMATLRFNHMELTFPPGTLTDSFRGEVAAFYG